MKFKAAMKMRSNPSFAMENTFSPIGFNGGIKGTLSAEVGTIAIGINEIPVSMRVPFLKRKKSVVLLGKVGAFKVKIDPVTLNIREVSFGAEGVLGTGKGMHVSTQGRVACRTEMQTAGQAAGHLGIGSVSFGDEKLDMHTNLARDRQTEETDPE
jgi:hypothetical protein